MAAALHAEESQRHVLILAEVDLLYHTLIVFSNVYPSSPSCYGQKKPDTPLHVSHPSWTAYYYTCPGAVGTGVSIAALLLSG